MQKEFIRLEEILKDKCGRGPVYYLANPGNWGDGLIRYGTLKFLRDVGIEFKELKKCNRLELTMAAMKRGTLIYGGGGAWSQLYNHSIRILNRIHKYFKQIVVLPSSYELNCQVPNTTFFCRDCYESQQNMPQAIFCHDMGFYIGKISSTPGNGSGYFFRTDKEILTSIEIPPENNDISLQGNHLSDIYPFFEEIAKYSVIHTNRVHVATAACLLGQELHLYPVSYFKTKAIYLSSIEGYFDKVHFHE